MSTKTKSVDIPSIEELKLSELTLDLQYSGRTQKEISANAKALAPIMEAHGMWDSGQPGQYFESDGKKVLCAGFTRFEAAKSAGFKVGYFTRSNEGRVGLLLKCFTTNQGKPISAWKQGERYAQLEAGENPEDAKKVDEVLAPMPIKEIAGLTGLSTQRVLDCIAVFQASPEIAELILDGSLSANVFNRVRQIGKTPAKQMEIIKAAMKVAKDEGRETTTMKHLDAVKANFIAAKKLKASASKPELPAGNANISTTTESASGASDGKKGEDSHSFDSHTAESKPATNAPVQSLAELGADSETVNKTKLAKYHKAVVECLNGCDADGRFAFEDDDIEFLAAALCKLSQPF